MKERIVGAFLVVAYACLMLFSPPSVFTSLVYLLGVLMLGELLEISGYSNRKAAYVVIFSFLFFFAVRIPHLFFLIPTASILWLFSYEVVFKGKPDSNFFAVALFFAYLLLGSVAIGRLDRDYFVLLLAVAWSTDTFAYLVGKFFGRRKAFPQLSPKKTVEGVLGGTAGGTVVSLFVASHIGLFEVSWSYVLLFAFLSGVAQFGDLFESFLKRHFGVKDSGATIPGHGGVLDRLDSSLAVAPFLVVLGGLQ